MKTKNLFTLLLILFTAVLLSACGGGGGGGTTTITPITYSISGTVTESNVGRAGVRITLSAGQVATTDSAGKYSFSGLANGSYTLTPSLAGYVFNPNSTIRTVSGANVSGVNFIATPIGQTHSISGTILVSGSSPSTGLAGATVSLFGTSLTTTTNASGDYSFINLADGPYTITPNMTGYTFSPSSSAQTLSSADISGVNFVALSTSLNPTRMTVKLFTAGTTTPIGALNMTLQLPVGVSVKSTVSPPQTDPGVAFQSGNAASSELFTATYTAASRTIFLQLGNTAGFASGEFATIVCDLTGVNPTASDFTVLSFTAWDADTSTTHVISGVTTSVSVSPSPARARIALSTSGTTTTVAAVDVTLALPVGVTLRSTLAPPETDPGVAFASGNAEANSLVEALYTSTSRTARVALISLYGFAPGEFATIIADLATGVTPTAGDFTVQSAAVSALSTATTITGAGVTVSVTLE